MKKRYLFTCIQCGKRGAKKYVLLAPHNVVYLHGGDCWEDFFEENKNISVGNNYLTLGLISSLKKSMDRRFMMPPQYISEDTYRVMCAMCGYEELTYNIPNSLDKWECSRCFPEKHENKKSRI